MYKKQLRTISGILLLSSTVVFGAAGRPSDGWLSFVVVLGFLGVVFGMLYLIDLLRATIRKLLHRNGEEAGF
jgi:hypothetical protein